MKNYFESRRLKNVSKILEIVSPIFVAMFLLAFLISSMHYGGKRESLASKAEGKLIEISLSASLRESPNQSVVISVKDSDLVNSQNASAGSLRDATIAEYAAILEQVLSSSPRHVFISWMAGAHELNGKHLNEVLTLIDKYQAKDLVTIALPASISGEVSKLLAQNYKFTDGDDCVYVVNSFCSYLPDYEWVIYRLTANAQHQPPPEAISTNLPHKSKNILLNLPKRSSIAEYSFSEINEGGIPVVHRGKTFFIGNDAVQPLKFQHSKYVLQRTFVPESESDGSLLYAGLPFHIFWAQISQMANNDDYIKIVSFKQSIFYAVLMCLLICVGFKMLGASGAFGVWLVCTMLFPFVNALNISHGGWYIPQFNILFPGFLFFLFITFLLQSTSIYKNSRSISESKSFSDVSEVKGNFISLISHNLNTPIAQIIGLLDVLIVAPQHVSDIGVIRKSVGQISQIHLCVKSVLLSTAIDQGSYSKMFCTASAFKERFVKDNKSTLRKIGFDVEFDSTPEIGGCLMDTNMFAHILSCGVALFGTAESGQKEVRISLGLDEPDGLIITLKGEMSPGQTEKNFFVKTIVQFLDISVQKFGGEWQAKGNVVSIKLRLT